MPTRSILCLPFSCLLSLSACGAGDAPANETKTETKTDAKSDDKPPVDTAAPPEAPPEPVAPPVLTKAEDVLPAGEVSAGSLVVSGEGFRFQIPPSFAPTSVEGALVAYQGEIEGMISPAKLTLSVSKRAFAGSVDELAAETIERLQTAGGTATQMPGFMQYAGAGTQAPRVRAKDSTGAESLYVFNVHEGQAYELRCDIAPHSNAWANVGSDCMIRGTTFHVAPPAAN